MPATHPSATALDIGQVTAPCEVSPELRRELTDCWIDVTNAGGAAGFPFPPVDHDDVDAVTDGLIGRLSPGECRLLTARLDGALVGWVVLKRDPNPLVAHWGTVNHLQVHPGWQGLGTGSALLRACLRTARMP
jgi:GNAT superfamily N-acetyltransferase